MKVVTGSRKMTATAMNAAGQRKASIRRIVNRFQSIRPTSSKIHPHDTKSSACHSARPAKGINIFRLCQGTATNPSSSYPSWLAREERKADRITIACHGTLSSTKFDAETCSVRDITQLGCRIALARTVSVGTYVSIVLPPLVNFEGWVAWSRAGEIGIDFSHPLPVDRLADLVAQDENGEFLR